MSYNYENESNSVNGIRNTEAVLGRCSVERQDTPDRHPATVTKTKTETNRGGNRNKNKKTARNILTWNIRTLLKPGKLANVTKEVERVKIDILGLAETRWRNSGKIQYGDYTLLYSGNEKRSERGVAPLRKIGMFGLGEGNDRGEDFTNWCEQNRLIITDTCFMNRDSRLYTWKSPGDLAQNQIDYICVNSRMRNSVLDCKTYPSADCGSDHQLLVACVRTCFKKTHKGEVRMRHILRSSKHRNDENMQNAAKTLWTQRQSSEKSTWETYKEICNNIKREFVPKKRITGKRG